jgi:predicted Zn-dependent peptidase
LFQDIFFHSVFPEKELEREKQVVMDEIQSYQDTPDEQIFDDFEDLVFAGHPLGKNILGSARSLKKFRQKNVLNFIHRNYRLDEVVIASVGRIEFKKLVRLVDRYFHDHPSRGESNPRIRFQNYRPSVTVKKKKTNQVHCLVGAPAYDFGHEMRIPLAILNNMLGGPGMNSRLSLALRERNGLTYHNESNYTAYSDAGIIHIYFGTDPAQYDKALTVVHQELRRLKEEKLSNHQLQTIKKQITGQMVIAQESNLAAMLAIGKSYLLQNRFDPIEMLIERIRQTTAEELIHIANEIFDEKQLSMLTFR